MYAFWVWGLGSLPACETWVWDSRGGSGKVEGTLAKAP